MPYLGFRRRLKHYGRHHPIAAMSELSFLVTVSVAMVWSLWSVYIDTFTHDPKLTGLVSGIFVAMGVAYMLLFSSLVNKWDRKYVFLAGLTVVGVTFIAMPFVESFWIFFILAAIIFAGITLRNLGLSMLTRDVSNRKTISKNEGIRFLVLNLGYMLGPLAVALIFTGTNFEMIFIPAGVLFLIGALFGGYTVKKKKTAGKLSDPLENFRGFWRSRERVRSYIVGAGLAVYFGYTYTYLPLLILYEGLPAKWIGFTMFGTIVPLVALEYFLSRAAPSITYHKMFVYGFLIAGVLLIAAAFATTISLRIALIVASAVGIAFIEPTVESYFYKITKREDENRYLGTFFTADRVGNVAGKLFGALLLFVFDLKTMVLGFGILMLGFAIVGGKVKH